MLSSQCFSLRSHVQVEWQHRPAASTSWVPFACSTKDEHKALQRAIQEPLDKARAVESQLQEKNEQLQRELDDAQD